MTIYAFEGVLVLKDEEVASKMTVFGRVGVSNNPILKPKVNVLWRIGESTDFDAHAFVSIKVGI